jgi:hypothetical protein
MMANCSERLPTSFRLPIRRKRYDVVCPPFRHRCCWTRTTLSSAPRRLTSTLRNLLLRLSRNQRRHGTADKVPDSTLIGCSRYEDSIFSQFIRPPSPDRVSTSTDARQSGIDAPDPNLSSSDADQGRITRHDQGTDQPLEARNKMRIRHRVKPPKTTIALRCAVPKSKQQGAQRRPRKTKSAHRRFMAPDGEKLVEDRRFVKEEGVAFHE